MTHNCPGDVGVLMQISNMQIVIPGTALEEDILIKAGYNNGSPTYFRLAEKSNSTDHAVQFGKACVIKQGTKASVIAVGNMLDTVLDAVRDEDVTLLYYTTLRPFDSETLINTAPNNKVLICEPYYSGVLTCAVVQAFSGTAVQIECVGIPHENITVYGTYDENLTNCHMTQEDILQKLRRLFD